MIKENISKWIYGALIAGVLSTAPIESALADAKSGLETRVESAHKPDAPDKKKKFPFKTDNFKTDSERVLMARMLYGEARNCSNTEKVAIAYTAVNRAHDKKAWNGKTVKEAILKPWQYSCFNNNDPNKKQLKNPEAYSPKAFYRCLNIAKGVLSGKIIDPAKATHYYNPNAVKTKPNWAYTSKKIGRIRTETGKSKHVYYRES